MKISIISWSDPNSQILKTNIETFYTIWDSMFFVLLIAFLIAAIFYGWATIKGKGFERILGYLFWFAVPLTILIILSGYANIKWTGVIVSWTYPILQPVNRFVLGICLWEKAENNGPDSDREKDNPAAARRQATSKTG